MSKDKKVISLDEHRLAQPRGRPFRADPASAPPAADAAPAAPLPPVPGRMIWLFCPACRTLEYTELDMPGGRVHNVCGSQVQEATVELDLRAEYSVARINLERLKILEQLLAGQRQRYEEYLHRLNLAAGRPLEPYAPSEDGVGALPVTDVDAFGLLISRFFHNPAAHFPELAAGEGAPESAAGLPPAPPSGPPHE